MNNKNNPNLSNDDDFSYSLNDFQPFEDDMGQIHGNDDIYSNSYDSFDNDSNDNIDTRYKSIDKLPAKNGNKHPRRARPTKPSSGNKKTSFSFLFRTILLGLSIGFAISLTNRFIFPKLSKKSPDIQIDYNDAKDIETGKNSDSSQEDVINNNNSVATDSSSSEAINVMGFSKAVKKAKPSIVCIESVRSSSDFWGSMVDSGSGIIFSEDDSTIFILTNHHVIKNNNNNIDIIFEGSTKRVSARHMVSSPDNDLAVLTVSKSDLAKIDMPANFKIVPAEFKSADSVEVGDFVLAIGNALGAGTVVTVGVLSGKNIAVDVEGKKLVVLQTDAALNPGNSGGALVNSEGRIIAINTAKNLVEGSEGMGYSISTDILVPIVEEIMGLR